MPQPFALTHGLFSRLVRATLSAEVRELASVIMGTSPPAPEVVAAAHEAADAIIELARVQGARRLMLAAGMREAFSSGDEPTRAEGDEALYRVAVERARDLRRLADYERRALSRRQKALRCFDYERIEAERRKG